MENTNQPNDQNKPDPASKVPSDYYAVTHPNEPRRALNESVNPPKRKKSHGYRIVMWVLWGWLALIGLTVLGAQGDARGWAELWAIFNGVPILIAIPVIWFVDWLTNRTKERENRVTSYTPGVAASAASSVTSAPQGSQRMFILAAIAYCAVITAYLVLLARESNHNLGNSSSPSPIFGSSFILAPALGILGLVGAGAAIAKFHKRKLLMILLIALFLPYWVIPIVEFTLHPHAKSEQHVNDLYKSDIKGVFGAKTFDIYIPNSKNSYTVEPGSRPHNTYGTSDVEVVLVKQADVRGEYPIGLRLSELPADTTHVITKDTKTCYNLNRRDQTVDCTYKLTTPGGIVIFSYDTEDSYHSWSHAYFFQIGQTYIVFNDDEYDNHGTPRFTSSSAVSDFVDNLKPTPAQELQQWYLQQPEKEKAATNDG